MKQVVAALGVVFLSEFADKSQLVSLTLGARYRLRQVLLGFVVAFATINVLSVAIGAALGTILSGRAVQVVSGIAFVFVGAWTLLSLDGDDDDDENGEFSRFGKLRSPIFIVAATSIVAELGDKTMIETAALAATGNPVAVWLGSTAGLVASSAIGASIGSALGARLPLRKLKVASAVIFVAVGISLILSN